MTDNSFLLAHDAPECTTSFIVAASVSCFAGACVPVCNKDSLRNRNGNVSAHRGGGCCPQITLYDRSQAIEGAHQSSFRVSRIETAFTPISFSPEKMSLTSIEQGDYDLPTDIKPTHYDSTIRTDLETCRFDGILKIKYAPASGDRESYWLSALTLDPQSRCSKRYLNNCFQHERALPRRCDPQFRCFAERTDAVVS